MIILTEKVFYASWVREGLEWNGWPLEVTCVCGMTTPFQQAFVPSFSCEVFSVNASVASGSST